MIFSGGEPHILTLVTTQKWEILRERETVGTDYPKPLRNDTGPSPWTDQKVVRTPAPLLVLISVKFKRLGIKMSRSVPLSCHKENIYLERRVGELQAVSPGRQRKCPVRDNMKIQCNCCNY